MEHNAWIYILVMAAVTYGIRALPLTLIRKEIKNVTIRSFLYYVPYVTLAVMTFPAILTATQSMLAGALGTGGCRGACLSAQKPFSGSLRCLRSRLYL